MERLRGCSEVWGEVEFHAPDCGILEVDKYDAMDFGVKCMRHERGEIRFRKVE